MIQYCLQASQQRLFAILRLKRAKVGQKQQFIYGAGVGFEPSSDWRYHPISLFF